MFIRGMAGGAVGCIFCNTTAILCNAY